jgi:hypothetical protein
MTPGGTSRWNVEPSGPLRGPSCRARRYNERRYNTTRDTDFRGHRQRGYRPPSIRWEEPDAVEVEITDYH